MSITEIIDDYREKRKRTARLYDRYQEARSKAATPPSSGIYTEIKTKGTGSREDLYIKMINAGEKWQLAALEELEARQRLFSFIIELKDTDEMEILYFHFIDGTTIKEIPKNWPGDISERQIFRKLKSGLEHLEAITAGEDPEE